MAKRRVTKATTRTWLIRAGVGIAAGVAVGFGVGALAVRMLQSPVTSSAEPEPANTRRASQQTAAYEPAPAEEEKQVEGIVVPQLIGLEEGDARQAILRAGFSVGSVTFKAGPPPMGTVVASFPVPGEAVVLPAMVNLILSDGKGSADSAAVPPEPSDTSSELPDAS